MPISKELYQEILVKKYSDPKELAYELREIKDRVKESIKDIPEITEVIEEKTEFKKLRVDFKTVNIKVRNYKNTPIDYWDLLDIHWKELEIAWNKIKLNHTKDIIEFLDWDFKGEQFFTKNAALREAKAQWSRIPSSGEFEKLIEENWTSKFNQKLSGFISEDRERVSFDGTEAVYWIDGSVDFVNNYILVWKEDFKFNETFTDLYCSAMCVED